MKDGPQTFFQGNSANIEENISFTLCWELPYSSSRPRAVMEQLSYLGGGWKQHVAPTSDRWEWIKHDFSFFCQWLVQTLDMAAILFLLEQRSFSEVIDGWDFLPPKDTMPRTKRPKAPSEGRTRSHHSELRTSTPLHLSSPFLSSSNTSLKTATKPKRREITQSLKVQIFGLTPKTGLSLHSMQILHGIYLSFHSLLFICLFILLPWKWLMNFPGLSSAERGFQPIPARAEPRWRHQSPVQYIFRTSEQQWLSWAVEIISLSPQAPLQGKWLVEMLFQTPLMILLVCYYRSGVTEQWI